MENQRDPIEGGLPPQKSDNPYEYGSPLWIEYEKQRLGIGRDGPVQSTTAQPNDNVLAGGPGPGPRPTPQTDGGGGGIGGPIGNWGGTPSRGSGMDITPILGALGVGQTDRQIPPQYSSIPQPEKQDGPPIPTQRTDTPGYPPGYKEWLAHLKDRDRYGYHEWHSPMSSYQTYGNDQENEKWASENLPDVFEIYWQNKDLGKKNRLLGYISEMRTNMGDGPILNYAYQNSKALFNQWLQEEDLGEKHRLFRIMESLINQTRTRGDEYRGATQRSGSPETDRGNYD
jgi:hypothetical protein